VGACPAPCHPFFAFHPPGVRHATLYPQDNIFEWHFAIRGPPDTEFEVRPTAWVPAALLIMLIATHIHTMRCLRAIPAALRYRPSILLNSTAWLLCLVLEQEITMITLQDLSAADCLQGGIYHGRILLPPEYPFKPPSFIMLTPNGRFETGVKVRVGCLLSKCKSQVARASVLALGL